LQNNTTTFDFAILQAACQKNPLDFFDKLEGEASKRSLGKPADELIILQRRNRQRTIGLAIIYGLFRFVHAAAVCIKGDNTGGQHLLKFFVIDGKKLTTDKGQEGRICQFPANQIVSGQPQLADDTGIRLLKGDILADDGVTSLRAQLDRSEQGKLGVLCAHYQGEARTAPDNHTVQGHLGGTELERRVRVALKNHVADLGFRGVRLDLQIPVYGAVADQEELFRRIADFDRLIGKTVRTIREIQCDPLCAGMVCGYGDCGVGCIDGDFRDIFKGVLSE